MDRTGYSPIDRQMYPPILAFRDLAVLKSWLFLLNRQPDEDRLHVFYRIDAAAAEMVHGKIPEHGGPMYKTLKMAKLFPATTSFRERRPSTSCIRPVSGRDQHDSLHVPVGIHDRVSRPSHARSHAVRQRSAAGRVVNAAPQFLQVYRA